jgi:NDP-sugar pyrophosphorylase family protein
MSLDGHPTQYQAHCARLSQSTVVIMVGGYGRRLFPLTEAVPKPLLPVAGTPVLARILDCLRRQGVQRVILCAHYQADKIRDFVAEYLSQLSRDTIKVMSLEVYSETEPTGTAGALRLLPEDALTTPVIVTNGDVLTELDYAAFLAEHYHAQNVITVATRYYQQTVPYGVLTLDESGRIEAVHEKPSRSVLINCGTYILSPQILSLLPAQGRVDMTDLIQLGLAQGHRVGSYAFDDYWLDIGQPADYEKANQDFLMNKSLSGSPTNLTRPEPVRRRLQSVPQTPHRASSESTRGRGL